MYKTILTTILIFLSFQISNIQGQCEVPFGDMETYSTLMDTSIVEGEEVITEYEINPGFVPAIRLFILAFSDILGDIAGGFFGEDPGLTDQFLGNQLGQAPYEPGADGTATGLKMGGDLFIPFSDAVSPAFPCKERPMYLQGYYRHVGSELDSAAVIVAFGDTSAGLSSSVLSVGTELGDVGSNEEVKAYATFFIEGGVDEYTPFNIPITYKDQTSEIDSAVIVLFVISDSLALAGGAESYYVFDELKLSSSILGTDKIDSKIELEISPNPALNTLNIHSDQAIEEIKIFNLSGQLQKIIQMNGNHNQKIDIESLPPGQYYLNINNQYSEKFIKLK